MVAMIIPTIKPHLRRCQGGRQTGMKEDLPRETGSTSVDGSHSHRETGEEHGDVPPHGNFTIHLEMGTSVACCPGGLWT